MPAPTTRRPVAKRRLLKDEAHDAIRDAILDGTFAPGERLDDQALTQWLGISRSPIREALNLLATEGLVEIHAQSHTSVVDPGPEEIEATSQALGVIVFGVFLLSAPRFDRAQRSEGAALIDAALERVERRDTREFQRLIGVEFIEFLIAHCPNRIVQGIAESTIPGLRFRGLIASGRRTPNWDLLLSAWSRIREGLLNGDVALASGAFAEVYRLPVAGAEWAPAEWAARAE